MGVPITAFDAPQTAVSKLMLAEGSGLGFIKEPPVATEMTTDTFRSVSDLECSASETVEQPVSVRTRMLSDSSEIAACTPKCDTQRSFFVEGINCVAELEQSCDSCYSSSKQIENEEMNVQCSVPHQNVISQTYISNKYLPTEMKWDYIIIGDIMMFSLPSDAYKKNGFRDGFVEFLEFGEEELLCSCAMVALEKNDVAKENQLSTLRFIGFSMLQPSAVPECLVDLVDDYVLMISPFQVDSDLDSEPEDEL